MTAVSSERILSPKYPCAHFSGMLKPSSCLIPLSKLSIVRWDLLGAPTFKHSASNPWVCRWTFYRQDASMFEKYRWKYWGSVDAIFRKPLKIISSGRDNDRLFFAHLVNCLSFWITLECLFPHIVLWFTFEYSTFKSVMKIIYEVSVDLKLID